MNTYTHAICTWVAARRLGADRSAAAWGAAGAALPDLPYVARAAALLAHGRVERQRLMEELDYFTEPAWPVDLALHSFLPVGGLLAARAALPGDHERRARWFLLGWLAHNLVDAVTHGSDARPHLWPVSSRRWKSRLSYWERDRHALPLIVAEHAVDLGLVLLALRRAAAAAERG